MMNEGMMGFSSMPQTHGVVFYPLRPFVPGGPTRWLTRDPIGERGGLNLYGFVGNNPMSFVDPYGLDSFVPGVNGSRENSLPALTLTGTPGGAVSASYPGPDSFVIGGLAIAGVGGVAAVVEDPVQALFVAAAILDAKYPPQSNLTLGVMPSWMGGPRAKCPTTTVLSDVKVVSKGKVVGQGSVYLRSAIEGIESGKIAPRDIFENRPLPGKTTPELPVKPLGYYQEFVYPTPGASGAGAQRIVRGAGGELYYTPDHYATFVPLNWGEQSWVHSSLATEPT
jgi:RHS repeat-associated protein